MLQLIGLNCERFLKAAKKVSLLEAFVNRHFNLQPFHSRLVPQRMIVRKNKELARC